ncbi:hypothetical protein MHYP_G00160670 [Metynnis hypsauchen]
MQRSSPGRIDRLLQTRETGKRHGRSGANSNKSSTGLKKPLIVPKVSRPMSPGSGEVSSTDETEFESQLCSMPPMNKCPESGILSSGEKEAAVLLDCVGEQTVSRLPEKVP